MTQKILIVDDDKIILELYSEFFKQKGFISHVCDTVDKAILELKNGDFDIILSDVAMPYKDGFEFNNILIQEKITTPIVYMTGFDQDVSIQQRLNKINKKWIKKPVKLTNLLDLVNSELQEQSKI